MSQAVTNPAKILAEREELQRLRDLRERLESETSDPETRAVLDEWAEEAGVPERLTLQGIREGKWTDSELAARGPEVRQLLDPNHVDLSGDVDAATIRTWSAEQIAEFGAEKALAVINAEANR
jgi:hypothetical protein